MHNTHLRVSPRIKRTSLPYLLDTELSDAVTQTLVLDSPLTGKFSLEELQRTDAIDEFGLVKPLPNLNDVKLSLLPAEEGGEASVKSFPLVVLPKIDNSKEFLMKFAKNNKEWIDATLRQYGAILFRGFKVDSAADMEETVQALEPNLNNQYRGTSPRNAIDGTEFVFSAAEVPTHWPIAQHLEMSFLPAPPKRLIFGALQAPKTIGGETALSDFRKVYQDLPKKLRQKLLEKKLLYTRTHHKKGTHPKLTHDVASMQSWAQLFGTDDKQEIERIARSENMPMKWTGRNQETFVSQFVTDAFQLHPELKEPVWFNHLQVFHWTTFPAELMFAFKRTKDVRFLTRALWSGLTSAIKYGLLRKKMALDISYGDGTPISVLEMHQIRKAVHKNMVLNRWEKGDLVMIDNFSTSHGRQPTYDSGRKIAVSWSDPIEKTNEVAA